MVHPARLHLLMTIYLFDAEYEMKIGDLIKSRRQPEGFESYSREWVGMVMEEEKWDGGTGYWIEYFEDRENWHWYNWDELINVEVISESR